MFWRSNSSQIISVSHQTDWERRTFSGSSGTCCKKGSSRRSRWRYECRPCGSSSRRCSNGATFTSMICLFRRHPENYLRFSAPTNLMHRTILMVLYATGVRRTELSLLKATDIDSKRMVVHIRQGKGARDRDIPLSPKLLEALREYWRWKKPRGYL